MAILHPDWTTIHKLNPAPTEGETAFLRFLESNLDDEYEIFFQPYLNGDQPDIVLMRRGGGVLVVEVKDWDLDNYYLDDRKHWHLKENDALLKSPVEQVLEYKKNLYNLHIRQLLELQLRNFKHWYVVSCALYFHKTTRRELWHFLTRPFKYDANFKGYKYFLDKNISLFGCNRNPEHLDNVLDETWISRQSKFFSEKLYRSFRRRLKPSWHTLENTFAVNFDSKQRRLTKSRPTHQKVRGIAGSGKTLVLAHRAVEAHKRTGGKVLILTYNITLKNYIHDRISAVREEFSWSSFRILNYHDFITSQMNNLGIPFTFPDDWDGWSRDDKDEYFESHYYSNLDLFAGHESNIQSYPAVFIDEFQDYKEEWARIIKRYFLGGQGLESDGELVIFGDWGQDIYGRSSNNFEVTPIPGRWNELDTPHRQQNPKVKALNITYQQKYFADRYEPRPEDQELTLFGSMDAEEHIRYRFRNQYDTDWIVSSIVDDMIELDIHPNDACIMGFSVGRIRSLDYSYRRKTREKTTSMCETVEFYNKLKHDCQRRAQRAKQDRNVSWSEMKSIKQRCLHELTRRIRKNKKWNFWMNAGTAKFSTIHSFKGWEAHTLFLVIEDDIMENERRELIYTGFTRCKNNLVIFNIGDADFDGFISNHAADLGIDTLT